MADGITKRRRKDGRYSYRAQVRIRRAGVEHSESATFSRHSLAVAWRRQLLAGYEAPGVLESTVLAPETLGALTAWYVDEYREVLRWGRNKQKTLEQIQRQPIARLRAAGLVSADVVDYVRSRRAEGAGPSTMDGALTWVGVVLKAAQSHGYRVNPGVVDEAKTACRQMGLIGSSRRRKRRPTASELERLHAEFSRGQAKGYVPMSEIVRFAVASSRRRNEILQLRWDDNDADTMTGLVRDAKHPRHKWGNHRRFKYTKAAWEIVQRQPKTSELIFPYKSHAVTMRFTRACQRLGIVDLRFHDLRHEATSRLFEAGGTITEVQQYTLHESWDMLRRYTQLRPEDVRQF